ncbi:MAG: glycosyltransferase [Actinobacteria bacterium]|nr:glycosyltransferase [Actinomycetota bacterium]MBU1944538.1 glycosyltransferase [Actinomycetota bacterium]MBU2689091.1 glycosyltransferase [Actinomycetota bacterium]
MGQKELNFAVIANSISEPATMGGGKRIAIECVKRWRAQGYPVTFFTNQHGKEMISRYVEADDEDFVIAVLPPGVSRGAFMSLPAAVYFYPFMTISGIVTDIRSSLPRRTVIYSTCPFWPDIFPAFFMRRRVPDSRWLVAQSMYAPPFWKGWKPYARGKWSLPDIRAVAVNLNQLPVYALVKRYCDGIFVNNQLDFTRAVSDGFDPDRIGIIGKGVDNSLCQLVPDTGEKKYEAVFLGRLHPQKGVLELVDIWRILLGKRPEARLAIIGNGPLEDKVWDKIISCGLEGRIDMLGFLDGPAKIRVFRASRVALHPAFYDSGGMAALEAMSCGLPGVSFDLPDLEVYYPQGMLKTRCYDLGDFANNIELLLQNEELYRRLSEEALEWAHQWDWDMVAGQLLELAERLF